MPADLDPADFHRLEEIHRSPGGCVFVALQRSTGRRVIVKERYAAELGRGREVTHELELYQRLPPHPNLVRCLGGFWRGGSREPITGQSSRGAVLSMVFELASGGDLHAALQQQRRSGRYLSERAVLQWFVPIAAGVQHLHAHGVVHRDLKSLNVVLHEGTPKICDLGVSRERPEDDMYMRSFCGTPAYLSPEMVATQPYTEKTDVWALGVVLYELAALRLPFLGSSLLEISTKIARVEFPPLPAHFSEELSALLRQMLSLDPHARPSVDQLIARSVALLEACHERRRDKASVPQAEGADCHAASAPNAPADAREQSASRGGDRPPFLGGVPSAEASLPSTLSAASLSADAPVASPHCRPPPQQWAPPQWAPPSEARPHAALVDRSDAPPSDSGRSSAASLRNARLEQRLAEREAFRSSRRAEDKEPRPMSSHSAGRAATPAAAMRQNSQRAGVPLSETDHRQLTEAELHAYVLAQQMARLHASAAERWVGQPVKEQSANPDFAARNVDNYFKAAANILRPPSSAGSEAPSPLSGSFSRSISSRQGLPGVQSRNMPGCASRVRPHTASSSQSYNIITGVPL
ncbi:hypothetical protein AB1Y20_008099 [Prymnesium parvum]|uniref:non-specific serine/threonine protein kinase n=1 Tax=Prymnesium parvum TaxID=97485 RepID=A0AB34ITL9_PRYPA